MRIRLYDSGNNPSLNAKPCGNAGYGEVEDYMLNIDGIITDYSGQSVPVNPVILCQ